MAGRGEEQDRGGGDAVENGYICFVISQEPALNSFYVVWS